MTRKDRERKIVSASLFDGVAMTPADQPSRKKREAQRWRREEKRERESQPIPAEPNPPEKIPEADPSDDEPGGQEVQEGQCEPAQEPDSLEDEEEEVKVEKRVGLGVEVEESRAWGEGGG